MQCQQNKKSYLSPLSVSKRPSTAMSGRAERNEGRRCIKIMSLARDSPNYCYQRETRLSFTKEDIPLILRKIRLRISSQMTLAKSSVV